MKNHKEEYHASDEFYSNAYYCKHFISAERSFFRGKAHMKSLSAVFVIFILLSQTVLPVTGIRKFSGTTGSSSSPQTPSPAAPHTISAEAPSLEAHVGISISFYLHPDNDDYRQQQ
jgi:hypothetical protein